MTRLFALTLLALVGCNPSHSAEKAVGYYTPAVRGEKTLFGSSFEISSTFDGHGKASYNPDTGLFDVDVDITSNPLPSLEGQRDRVPVLTEYRKVEWEGIVKYHETVGANITNAINAVGSIVDKATGLIGLGRSVGGAEGSSMVSTGQSMLSQIQPYMVQLEAAVGAMRNPRGGSAPPPEPFVPSQGGILPK